MTRSIRRNLQRCFSRLMSCSSPQITPNKSQNPNSIPSSSSPSPPPLHQPPTASSSDDTPATAAPSASSSSSSSSDEDLDLASAIASRRLLPPSSPGRTSSAIADPSAVAVGIGVAVPTYSPDPYGDFRRSMEEMAAAMGLLRHPGVGLRLRQRRRERLYELLLCYLTLNRKHAHRYIVGAFADLLVGLPDDNDDDADAEEEVEEAMGVALAPSRGGRC